MKIINILGLVQKRTITVGSVTILGESMTFPLVELSSCVALTTYLIPLHESRRPQTHQELREREERETERERDRARALDIVVLSLLLISLVIRF